MPESKTSVFDVAKYILERTGSITMMKLQKLVYYAQAWSLVWDEAPLFDEPILAWVNGPVVYELLEPHQDKFTIVSDVVEGDAGKLTADQRETVNAVIESYGDMTGAELSMLSHDEQPCIEARKGVDPAENGDHVISLASMAEFYTSMYMRSNG